MNIVKPQPVVTTPKVSKMTLGAVIRGKQDMPIRTLLFGTEGIGKSSWAAAAPRPIFIGVEDGTAHLDVERFPAPETWDDVKEAVRVLTQEEHPYKTLVIDTLDWAEPLLWAHLCKRDSQPNIEAYGYGKGYQAALDEWRVFLAQLERARARGMHVILLAHAWIKSFKNPAGNDYDRFELKLHPKAGGLLKEWVDSVLFATYETFAEQDTKTKRVKGISTGARIVHTTHSAAWDAKNRHSLPDQLPLDYEAFAAAMRTQQVASPEAFVTAIRAKAAPLTEDVKKKVEAAITRAGGNAEKLAQLNNWMNAQAGGEA